MSESDLSSLVGHELGQAAISYLYVLSHTMFFRREARRLSIHALRTTSGSVILGDHHHALRGNRKSARPCPSGVCL